MSDGSQHIIFPGGGVYFWWQAGTIQALKETLKLDSGSFTMHGASAGSISSVMAACDINLEKAMDEAMDLPKKSKGLSHGHLIEKWLNKILPEDCHIRCTNRVNISITTITMSFFPLHRKVINVFDSKQDVIDACLTSSHIPFFLDGNFSRTFHGDCCVDGSFLFLLHNTPWPKAELLNGKQRALMFYHRNDTCLMKHHFGILQVLDQESTMLMFKMGHRYGKNMLNKRECALHNCFPQLFSGMIDSMHEAATTV
jgi:hypothetical protein